MSHYWCLHLDCITSEESFSSANALQAHQHACHSICITMEDLPVVDLSTFLNGKQKNKECETVVELLNKYGLLVLRDPRVFQNDQDAFLDMMEEYFGQEMARKEKDIRKEYHYQIGATPNGVEQARNHCSRIKALDDDQKPTTLCPPEVDPKWRFFWRMGKQPEKTEFPALNAAPVLPAHFPQWEGVMDKWGGLMLSALETVAEMMALGCDLPRDTFTSLMNHGPHLLAPTGSDFNRWGAKGTVMANYHYDLNFLTIHGRSRFPGLFVWTREGQKLEVKVPPGCLLIQAGKQAEYLTGGHLLAGYHEVVVSDRTVAAIESAKESGKSLWRVSSTLFGHIASDQVLAPLPKFSNPESRAKYPSTKAGKQVGEEIAAIKLAVQ